MAIELIVHYLEGRDPQIQVFQAIFEEYDSLLRQIAKINSKFEKSAFEIFYKEIRTGTFLSLYGALNVLVYGKPVAGQIVT